MFYRLYRLFDRFCARNLLVTRPGVTLTEAGTHIGEVTQITRRGNRLGVSGKTRIDLAGVGKITLHCGEEQASTLPHPVPAVPDALGKFDPWGSFDLDLPFSHGRLRLCLKQNGQDGPVETGFDLPVIAPGTIRRARLALVLPFGLGLIRAFPLILRWAKSRDPALRPRIRAALGLWTLPMARPLSAGLFGERPASLPEVAITCVLPVYNALDLLPECLDRICRNTDLPWHLVLIEDASPDPAVRPYLRDWVAAQKAKNLSRVTLLENAENLGFIGSVNRGFAIARARVGPVILLNSDAFVPPNWASRLVRPLLLDPAVASTTPMSNDAEIFSVPVICAQGGLDLETGDTGHSAGLGDAIDAVAQGFAPGAGDAIAPTGVGFCMAFAADWLARVPAFDQIFGRGYGEEVDWCQRTRALGARHLGVADLFVEHRGGSSFGAAQKSRLIASNSAIISARYPAFDAEVQDYLRSDPMITPRLALGVAWLAAAAGRRAVPIYLAHALGGGVDHYQRRRIAADVARQGGAVMLRIGTARRWRLEVHTPQGVTMGETDDLALITRLLTPLTRRCVIYSSAVGDSDPLAIPQILLDMVAATPAGPAGDRIAELEVLLHDFYPLSPSINLLGSDGVFHGVPDSTNPDPAHSTQRPDGQVVPLAEWRAAWRRLFAAADRIVVFSADSRAVLLQVWPDLAPRIQLCPHSLHHPVPRIAPKPGPRPVVGILGNLNRPKGSALVAEIARQLASGPEDMDLVVIGDTDPANPPPRHVKVHGPYRLAELPLLTRRHHITGWLIPSVCPETFSYTTHEALATGLPVFCLDLGAQAEAVRAASAQGSRQGHVIPCRDGLAEQARAVLAQLRTVLKVGS